MPPLVTPAQIDHACDILADAASGKAFIIQGGDCAESFDDVRYDIVRSKRALLAKQQQILQTFLRKPVVEIGRIAGQYAKPRSTISETLSCGTVTGTFRGHNVNSADPNDRLPDPERLLIGYHLAAATLGYLRIFKKKNVQPGYWDSKSAKPACSDFFTSHEALNLPLESALTTDGYNTSAECLWIGERTRAIGGAHVEYIRGLRNPIGIKLGPTTDPSELIKLLNIVCPDHGVGRVTLITRLGCLNVETCLPKLVHAVENSGHHPVWMCDPCHANTITTSRGIKTRLVTSIVTEAEKTFVLHQECGTYLGGLHLEQTGEDVTECVDSIDLLDMEFTRYESLCDPRLSRRQAIHVVQTFATFAQRYSSVSKQAPPHDGSSAGTYLETEILRLSLSVEQPVMSELHTGVQPIP